LSSSKPRVRWSAPKELRFSDGAHVPTLVAVLDKENYERGGDPMNITESELIQLKSARSSRMWNVACDKIKEARGGAYPPDWYAKVLSSGLMRDVSRSWERGVA
jgi:hypothetical protein